MTSPQKARRTLAHLQTALPEAVARVVMPRCEAAVSALEQVRDGFFLPGMVTEEGLAGVPGMTSGQVDRSVPPDRPEQRPLVPERAGARRRGSQVRRLRRAQRTALAAAGRPCAPLGGAAPGRPEPTGSAPHGAVERTKKHGRPARPPALTPRDRPGSLHQSRRHRFALDRHEAGWLAEILWWVQSRPSCSLRRSATPNAVAECTSTGMATFSG
jgi:hypothetical protein